MEHRVSETTIAETLESSGLEPGKYYVHKKTRGVYFLVALAVMEADLAPVAVYRRTTVTYVRPTGEFMDKFERYATP